MWLWTGNRLLSAVCVVSVSICLFSCQAKKPHKPIHSPDPNDPNVAAIVELITKMPSWGSLTAFDVSPEDAAKTQATVHQIECAVYNISRYDLSEIRDAMELSLKGVSGDIRKVFAIMPKFLVMNEYLFDLPPTDIRGSQQFWLTGGGFGTPVLPKRPNESEPNGLIHVRWPWSRDASGDWQLTGRVVAEEGPPYPALEVFDYYQKTFGKRPNILPPSESNK
jgi:hypothetical protein